MMPFHTLAVIHRHIQEDKFNLKSQENERISMNLIYTSIMLTLRF